MSHSVIIIFYINNIIYFVFPIFYNKISKGSMLEL